MKRLLVLLGFAAALALPPSLSAEPEHSGFRIEILNRRLVNLYGIGTYTHRTYMDAEMLFYVNPRTLDVFYLPDHKGYMSFFATFAVKSRPLGWFPVLRDFPIQPYAGVGTFPFLIKGFLGNLTLGVEFLQTEHVALDLNLKWIYAVEDGIFQWLPEGWALCLGARF
jgi:hypothetical protein